MSDTHSTAIQLIPLHHQMELLVDLVVLGLCPRRQVEVGLVVRVVPAPGAAAPLVLLLVQGLKKVIILSDWCI